MFGVQDGWNPGALCCCQRCGDEKSVELIVVDEQSSLHSGFKKTEGNESAPSLAKPQTASSGQDAEAADATTSNTRDKTTDDLLCRANKGSAAGAPQAVASAEHDVGCHLVCIAARTGCALAAARELKLMANPTDYLETTAIERLQRIDMMYDSSLRQLEKYTLAKSTLGGTVDDLGLAWGMSVDTVHACLNVIVTIEDKFIDPVMALAAQVERNMGDMFDPVVSLAAPDRRQSGDMLALRTSRPLSRPVKTPYDGHPFDSLWHRVDDQAKTDDYLLMSVVDCFDEKSSLGRGFAFMGYSVPPSVEPKSNGGGAGVLSFLHEMPAKLDSEFNGLYVPPPPPGFGRLEGPVEAGVIEPLAGGGVKVTAFTKVHLSRSMHQVFSVMPLNMLKQCAGAYIESSMLSYIAFTQSHALAAHLACSDSEMYARFRNRVNEVVGRQIE